MLQKLVNKFGDKTVHVWAGALIALIGGIVFYIFFDANFWIYPLVGFIVGNIAGLFKEFVYDKALKFGQFSWADLLATFYGTLVGSIMVIMSIGTIEHLGK